MLGFPIRTPPDHSLVANSPGLIAGSNVLHRLLMPRHPPCALHSLSQQRHNNTRLTTHATRHDRQPKNTRPTPNQRMSRQTLPTTTGKETGRRPKIITHPPHTTQTPIRRPGMRWRCSRPLCRSQTTTPPTPAHPRPGTLGRREEQKPNPTPPTPDEPGWSRVDG